MNRVLEAFANLPEPEVLGMTEVIDPKTGEKKVKEQLSSMYIIDERTGRVGPLPLSAQPLLGKEYAQIPDKLADQRTLLKLDIDKYKLEIPRAAQMTMEPQPDEQMEQGGPDSMSQVPSPLQDMMAGQGSNIPQTEFPGSPALVGGNPV